MYSVLGEESRKAASVSLWSGGWLAQQRVVLIAKSIGGQFLGRVVDVYLRACCCESLISWAVYEMEFLQRSRYFVKSGERVAQGRCVKFLVWGFLVEDFRPFLGWRIK